MTLVCNRMKVLIVYHTLTQNTKLLATTIYEHIKQNHQVDIKETKTVSSSIFNDYDLVFMGSPCHDSDLSRVIIKLLRDIPMNPTFKLAGFYCHSTFKRDDPYPNAEILFDKWAAKGIRTFYEIANEKKLDLLGVFNCMGAPSPDILTFINMEIITDENEQEPYREEVNKHPDSKDLEELRIFADQIIDLIKPSRH